ncbi:MAG TPA: UDP-2,3-diacylglucosamine diphosphatase, partial [Methylibium sp.]|nr:UDP-2,3-diacylglucosamine diphosphatase [Methylibium sp.]
MQWNALSFRLPGIGAAAAPVAPQLPLPADGADADEPADADRLRVRSVWISDVHLGTPGCQAAALLDFLKRVDS